MKKITMIVFCLSLLLNSLDLISQTINQTQVSNKLSNTNAYFVENKGQWPSDVLFMANGKSTRTWITKTSMLVEQFASKENSNITNYNNAKIAPEPIKAHATGFIYDNSSFNTYKGINETSIKTNFQLGKNSQGKMTNAATYKEVIINNIYNGIDIRYYFEDGELRYDYIVKPNADPKSISLSIKGAENINIENKQLVVQTSINPIKQRGLLTYQINSYGEKEIIESEFKLESNKLQFNIGNYDKNKELIIDPLVLIEQHILAENNGDDVIYDIALNQSNEVYFCGTSTSPTFPVTYGGYSGNRDLIIGKMDPALNIQWITFLGGSEWEDVHAMEIDNNYIYFIGRSGSNDYPMVNPYFNSIVGSWSNFFTVIDLAGNFVHYSTFLGNEGDNNWVAGLKVAPNGNVYLAGAATSYQTPNFNIYRGITNQNWASSPNINLGFIMGFEPTGGLSYNLIFSTFFGGDEATEITDLDIDEYYNIYITGKTRSSENGFGITPGAYDELNTFYEYTNFIAKLHMGASNLEIDYNSFFGLLSNEITQGAHAILYRDKKVFIGGFTDRDGIPMLNSFDPSFSGERDGFISAFQLNYSGTYDLMYSSYFGEKGWTEIWNLAWDPFCKTLLFVGDLSAPLLNYTGTLNQTFFGWHDIFTGVIDINQTTVNTLTELAYLNNGVSQNYAGGYTVQFGSTNNVYVAGTARTNTWDIAAFHLTKSNCYIPPCRCPANRNTWLTLTSTKNACPDSGSCKITHSLLIPPGYQCYTHYKLETIIDGVSTFTPIFALNYSGTIQGIDRCIEPGSKYTVRIYLLEYPNDPTACIVQKTIGCACDCPSFSNEWLTVEAFKAGGNCDSTHCLIKQALNIPSNYDCYTDVEYSSTIDGNMDVPPQMSPIGSFNISALNKCIAEGETYEVTIKLYKGVNDPNPCVIKKKAYCDISPEHQPCLPDCFDWKFEKQQDLMVELENCPGCFINIKYYSRHACNIWQDIQITGIEKFNGGNNSPYNCDACSDAEIYRQAVKAVIAHNKMGFMPLTSTDPCSDIWRVSKASCWATWEKLVYNNDHTLVKKVTINKPCNNDCCLRRMRVCRLEDGSVEVKDLGIIADYNDCKNQVYIQPEPPFHTLECKYTCDMLDNMYEIYKPKKQIEPSIKEFYFNNYPNSLIINLNVSQSNNYFRVLVDESNASNISINIYNLAGELIANLDRKIELGMNNYDIDINNYLSGTYLYSITIDGINVKSGKFNIVK